MELGDRQLKTIGLSANRSLTIAAPLISTQLQIADSCGMDTDIILDGAGLKKSMLLNPMARVTLLQHNAIWQAILELTKNPAIGLQFGQHIKLPGIGLPGYLIMNTNTIADGMKRFCRYERLLTNAYRSEIVADSDRLVFATCYEGNWQSERRCTLDFALSSARTLVSALSIDTGSNLPILEACFQYERPLNIEPYIEFFGNIELKFGCADTRLVFAGEFAKRQVIGANSQMLVVFEEQAKILLAQYERDNFSDRVRQEIAKALQGETPVLDRIAARFHLSSRSLQLKLKEEGTSYQTLLDEVRRDMAIAYVRNSDLNKTEIAYLLGFSGVSAFSRTFKRWTGQAPSSYQDRKEARVDLQFTSIDRQISM